VKNPKGLIAHWNFKLQKYTFEPMHKPGVLNSVPDILSRSFADHVKVASIKLNRPVRDRWYLDLMSRVQNSPNKYPLFRVQDNKLYKLVKSWNPFEDAAYKLVVPKCSRTKIMQQMHEPPEAGHFGFFKTYNRIAEQYYWPKMRSDISNFVAKCKTCLAQKPCQSAKAGLMSSRVVEKPWQVLCSDLVGPFPRSKSGNTCVFSVVDFFSKFVILTPVKDGTAKSICPVLEKMFQFHGAPELLVQDNAKVYNSNQFKDLAKKYNCRIQYTPRYHAQANPTERVNRVFETVMRCYINENQKTWDEHLSKISFAINSSVHETTRYSPYFLFMGRQPTFDGSDALFDTDGKDPNVIENYAARFPKLKRINELVKQKMIESGERQKHYYNLRRRPSDFKIGDRVMKRNFAISNKAKGICAKLLPYFVGPYILKEQVAENIFSLVDAQDHSTEIGTFHVQDLKRI
jgi:transposase InsO family protein